VFVQTSLFVSLSPVHTTLIRIHLKMDTLVFMCFRILPTLKTTKTAISVFESLSFLPSTHYSVFKTTRFNQSTLKTTRVEKSSLSNRFYMRFRSF